MQLNNFARMAGKGDSLSLQQSSWEGGLKPVPPPTPPPDSWTFSTPKGSGANSEAQS